MSFLTTLRGLINDIEARVARVDTATHTLQTITYEHHEIHAGSSFTAGSCSDISAGNNLDILIVTPNTTKWAHMIYEFECESEYDLRIYETVTASASGSVVNAYNRDRNSGTAATVQVYQAPTITSTGSTEIRCWHAGSGKAFGGDAHDMNEFILKQDTKYLVRLNNASVGNNYMSIRFNWYEHTNKS